MTDSNSRFPLFRPGARLLVFDPNITRTSPAGSCVLSMLQPLIGECDLHLFVTRCDLPESEFIHQTHIPAPRRPVFASSFLYTVFSLCAFAIHARRRGLRIGTEGAFPLCDLCYAHSCHSILLSRYRRFLGGGPLRRGARILTHAWGAFTERIAFRSARTIVVPSEGLARDLKSAYPKLIEGKIRVIPNPVDTKAFERPRAFFSQSIQEQLGFPSDSFVLSFCALGNFERKGLRLAMNALAALPDIPARLIVIGGTSGEVREYQTLAERLGIGKSVCFVGLQNDIRPYLWASEAFVFPSLHETFPLVCLQAAAAGLPLIATRIHGVEEFMIHGATGWLVDRAAASIQSAIEEAAGDRNRTAAMGRAARERVEMYSEDRFQRRWVKLLKEEFDAH